MYQRYSRQLLYLAYRRNLYTLSELGGLYQPLDFRLLMLNIKHLPNVYLGFLLLPMLMDRHQT
jgi:hypothetical protein